MAKSAFKSQTIQKKCFKIPDKAAYRCILGLVGIVVVALVHLHTCFSGSHSSLPSLSTNEATTVLPVVPVVRVVPVAKINPVVISAAMHYKTPVFRRFLLTLRTVYQGDVVLIVQNVSESAAALLRGMRVNSLEVNQTESEELSPSVYRWLLYSSLCVAPYTHCFMTDFRDVFFQADPFMALPLPDADLIFQQEYSVNMDIKREGSNARWIFNCYGQASLDLIGNNSVINSGTFLGTPGGVHQLVGAMKPDLRRCSNPGLDQGILNWIVYSGSLTSRNVTTFIQPFGKGIVKTLGIIEPPIVLHELRTVDDNRTLAPVLHQFDRWMWLRHPWKDVRDFFNAWDY